MQSTVVQCLAAAHTDAMPLETSKPASIPLHYPAGTVLFRPGDACAGFVVIRSGAIRVSLTGVNGREITLYRVTAGEVCLQTFRCLIEGRDYGAEGIAESDVIGEIVPAAVFQACLANDCAFRNALFLAVAHRFADFEARVEDIALASLEVRLARALLNLAGPRTVVAATHETLAHETGSGRAAISRQLGHMVRMGWIEQARGSITLNDRAALQSLAKGDG